MTPVSVHLVIVTPVSAHLADYFPETAQSVAMTRRLLERYGHKVFWSVCVDGTEMIPAEHLKEADTVVHLGSQWGVSVARSVAANAAPDGSWIFPLDGDDLIAAEGALELADALGGEFKTTSWVATNRLTVDNRRTRSFGEMTRRFAPGEVNAEYTHPYLFHPNNVTYRAEAVFEAGAWPATPGGEDLALLLRVARQHAGLLIPAVTVRYRVWEKQTTALGSTFRTMCTHRDAIIARFGLLAGRDSSQVRSSLND